MAEAIAAATRGLPAGHARLRVSWAAAVGPKLASRSRVLALDHGVLDVAVPDGRWATELEALSATVLARLEAQGAEHRVRALRFRVRPGLFEPREGSASPASAPQAAAPQAEDREVVEAAGVDDEVLAEAIARAHAAWRAHQAREAEREARRAARRRGSRKPDED